MGNIDPGVATVLVSAVAAVDIGALGSDTGQPLDLLDLSTQRVAIIWIARKSLHADNELAASATRIGHRDRGLDAELVPASRLSEEQWGSLRVSLRDDNILYPKNFAFLNAHGPLTQIAKAIIFILS